MRLIGLCRFGRPKCWEVTAVACANGIGEYCGRGRINLLGRYHEHSYDFVACRLRFAFGIHPRFDARLRKPVEDQRFAKPQFRGGINRSLAQSGNLRPVDLDRAGVGHFQVDRPLL